MAAPLTRSPARRLVPGAECHLDLLGRLARGPGDPTHRRSPTGWWRASVTPDGGVLLHLGRQGDDVLVRAWGPGAEWALHQCPRLLGRHDDPGDFRPAHPLLREAWRRRPHLRVGATDRVCETLLPTVIEQKVTGAEAFRSIRLLTLRFADPAPGPAQEAGSPASGMRLPLTPDQWAGIASWDYLRAGVEQKRSATVVAAARRAASLERIGPDGADRALRSLPGVGEWTSALTRQQALGDPDAWSIGDYHVPGAIGRTLLGREPVDAAEVDAALEPYRGHRYRVEQLVAVAGVRQERHGPRRSLPEHLPWVARPARPLRASAG
ncbi:MAG TPA: DNA-3-methyladenine glycosylase 2 family protein [Propionibacteriaceae bacterium]|nr:DNA-3-methyladenine glycosylase 2 family protein [Propionibacteriaceae bacterium]